MMKFKVLNQNTSIYLSLYFASNELPESKKQTVLTGCFSENSQFANFQNNWLNVDSVSVESGKLELNWKHKKPTHTHWKMQIIQHTDKKIEEMSQLAGFMILM